MVATDASQAALDLAQENAREHGLDVTFVQADLLDGLDGPFDLVVSNPPYVESDELAALEPEVRDWEPRSALVDEGQTGRLVADASRVLEGWLVLEVHERHACDIAALLATTGYDSVRITLDLAGKERVVEARWQQTR